VDVADGGTCLCRTDAGLRDLLRRDRERRVCARVGKLPVTAQVKMVGFMTLPRISCPGCTILRASLGLDFIATPLMQ
jgi:hypothetical protein